MQSEKRCGDELTARFWSRSNLIVRLERARSDHGLPIKPAAASGDDLFAQRHYSPGNHALDLQVGKMTKHE